MCGCQCCERPEVRHGAGPGARLSHLWTEPTKAERKEVLEAFKKRLEDRLADVDEELRRL